jgi:hypothetical protein
MPSTSNISFNVIDESFQPENPSKGIAGFMGVFKRGPVGKNSEVFTSWTRFKRVYGGLITTSDDPLIAKRALQRGAKLRVCGIRHFTDITSSTALDGVKSTNLDTKVLTLSGALVSTNTAIYTINAVPISQVYTVSSENTLKLLAAKIKAAYPLIIDSTYVLGNVLKVTQVSGTGVLTVTGAGAPTVTPTVLNGFKNAAGLTLFTITPKYIGVDYNNLRVSLLPPSNGLANYFDIKVEFAGENDFSPEVYTNLIITASTIANSTFLENIVRDSTIVDVAYEDLSAEATPIVPLVNYSRYTGGKNGLHAFDSFSDMLAIGSSNSADSLAIAGAAYAANRKDLQYIHHFTNSLTSAATINAAKDALNIDTPYIQFWTGGLKVLNPLDNQYKNISAIGDILGASSSSEVDAGPWYSFAGINRGMLNDSLDVVNNFYGANSNPNNPDLGDLEALANHQINSVINQDGRIYLSGNFSGQLALSKMSFNNTVRLVIYIKKVLRPLLQKYLEEPNDIPTWKDIYLDVTAAMDPLVNSKRALFSYSWEGDQFANSLDDLQINNVDDVGLGKYAAKLLINSIASLQQIGINVIITASSVSFEDAELGTSI